MKKSFVWHYALVASGLVFIVVGILIQETKKIESPEKTEAKSVESKRIQQTAESSDQEQTSVTKITDKKINALPAKKLLKKTIKADRKDQSGQELEEEVNQAINKYKKVTSSDEKIDLLESLSLIDNKKIIDLVYNALDDPDENVRLAAAQLLEDSESEAAIPAISKALNDESEEIRLLAINALDDIDCPEATSLLVKGADDSSEDVRDAVFFILADRDSGTKEALLQVAMTSNYQDVKDRVSEIALDTPSHNTMEIVMEGLKDKDEKFCEEIRFIISHFVSEEFETYEDARDWWSKNKDKFDEELSNIAN